MIEDEKGESVDVEKGTNFDYDLNESLLKFIEENGILDKAIDLSGYGITTPENISELGFDSDNSQYIPVIMQELIKQGILKEYDLGQEFDSLDKNLILKLSKSNFPIFMDNDTNDIYIKSDEGNIICNLNINPEKETRKHIADLLPDVTLDVVQNGIKERAVEIDAAYKVVVINKLFRGLFNKDIARLINNYDFENLKGEITFLDILNMIRQNSSSALRVILAACNYKMTEIKTKKENLLYLGLSDQENQELLNLKVAIASVRIELEKDMAAAESKGNKLLILEKGEDKIQTLIDKSKVGILYKILHLNVDAINDSDRLGIANCARNLAFKIKEFEHIDNRDSLVKKIESSLRRRAIREYIHYLKADYLKKIDDGIEVVIRTKG